MKLFSADELELIRLEVGRKRIADLREKLRRMKKFATDQSQDNPVQPEQKPAPEPQKTEKPSH